jgi:signal transduction histidine kinase/CheY-like chemotaxis protein
MLAPRVPLMSPAHRPFADWSHIRHPRNLVKLRRQISVFLLLLGLTPLLIAVAINVPLILDRLELFYHEAYLEKLRASFNDLDQHISRRQEMVRLFAKLPEPGIDPDAGRADAELVQQRSAYTDWANKVLFDQLDVIQVIFIRKNGEVSFSLDRNQKTGLLEKGDHKPDLPGTEFFLSGLNLAPGSVLTSPISFNQTVDTSAPNRFMTLRFISPLIKYTGKDSAPELQGLVLFNLDVGGLAHIYNGIYWVQNNGEYLSSAGEDAPRSTAFVDFPGLEELFAKGRLDLWEKAGQQIFWLPLFVTRDSGPLWVGRSVDPSPIAEFRRTLELRVIAIVTGLLLVVFVVARVIAIRMERISSELTDGITQVLEHDRAVEFSWQRPEELRSLGRNLTSLAEKHAHDTSALRSHAQQLEESNRYKSEFLANVSHELRTPLNSILLLSKMMASGTGEMSQEHRQQSKVIYQAGKDLRALIDTILDLSKVEAGKVTVRTETVGLPELLHDLSELMRPQFREKGLQLDLVIDAGTPASLITDREKLRQILVNFLSNALKFTEQGGATLRLSLNEGDDAELLPVALSVQDSGIGIPAEKQALVFEAFSQVDGSTSRRYGGTGLGLTISRELAELIGARIDISSQEGAGSTFALLLPLSFLEHDTSAAVERLAVATGEARARYEHTEIPEAQYSGSRVLLVDDDLRNLLALTPLLERWGIGVVAAGDGHEALETLNDDADFDLVLMDLMMPDMDGFETIQSIRSDPDLETLPIVALSARTADEGRDRAMASGANDYLCKPVEPADLKMILDRHLGSRLINATATREQEKT